MAWHCNAPFCHIITAVCKLGTLVSVQHFGKKTCLWECIWTLRGGSATVYTSCVWVGHACISSSSLQKPRVQPSPRKKGNIPPSKESSLLESLDLLNLVNGISLIHAESWPCPLGWGCFPTLSIISSRSSHQVCIRLTGRPWQFYFCIVRAFFLFACDIHLSFHSPALVTHWCVRHLLSFFSQIPNKKRFKGEGIYFGLWFGGAVHYW